MAQIATIKLLLRRGSNDDRKKVVFDVGELGYITERDARRIIVGDGLTMGGFSAGMRFRSGHIAPGNQSFSSSLSGDLIYHEGTQSLFVLTGADFTLLSNFYNVNPKTDNRTLVYNSRGEISVNTNGLSSLQVSSSIFDSSMGIRRESAGAKFRINIDNVSIIYNNFRRLAVDPNSVNWGLLPTSFPGPNLLWIDTTQGNTVKYSS